MRAKMRELTYLTKSTEELKKLIAENPDLPIVVLASEDANCGDYSWMYCSNIYFSIDEILCCDFYDHNEVVFDDREEFEEKIADLLWYDYKDKSEEEYEAAIKQELEKYEPYWKKVIAIWATN